MLTGFWNLKYIQNRRQTVLKNKLVRENAVTQAHGSCLLPVMGSRISIELEVACETIRVFRLQFHLFSRRVKRAEKKKKTDALAGYLRRLLVCVLERVRNSVILVCKRAQKDWQMNFMAVKNWRKRFILRYIRVHFAAVKGCKVLNGIEVCPLRESLLYQDSTLGSRFGATFHFN